MVENKSNAVQNNLIAALNGQYSYDKMPYKVSDEIVPTISINPLLTNSINLALSNSCTNSTTTSMITTPKDKDFYVTSVALSVIKDITSTSVNSAVQVVINGQNVNLLAISGITLTPQSETMTTNYTHPLKLDKFTDVAITNTTNVANITTRATITYFTIDNSPLNQWGFNKK